MSADNQDPPSDYRFPAVRLPVILLLLTLSAAAAAGVWLFLPLPKKYAAVVYHIASQPQALLAPPPESRTDFESYKRSQMALVKSRRTLNAALKQQGISDLQMVRTARPDIYAWLETHLTVESDAQLEYVRVTLEGEDEEELLTLLRALDKAYRDASADRDNEARNTLRANLDAALTKVRADLAQHQDRINQIAGALGARDEVALTVIASDLRADLSQENRRTRMLEEDLELAQAQLDAAKKAAGRKAAQALTGAWVEVGLEKGLPFDEGRLPAAQAECDRIKSQRDRGRKRVKDIIEDIDRHNKSKTQLDRVRSDMAAKEKVAAELAVRAERLKVETQPQFRVAVADEPYIVTGLEGNRRLTFALLAAAGVFAVGFGGLVVWKMHRRCS